MSQPLEVRTFGGLEVLRDGATVELPASRKTRALLAYLTVTARPHRRERLCEIFFEIPDDPRGALRWSLTKLRRMLDDPGAQRIVATRDSVRFDPCGVAVDVIALREQLQQIESMSPVQIIELAALVRGDFLEDLDLPNCPAFQNWLVAERDAVRGLRRQLLLALTTACGDDVETALAHARRLSEIDPRDETTQVVLIRLLARSGRLREAREQHRVAATLLEAADQSATGALARVLREIESATGALAPQAVATETTAAAPPSGQRIQFCTANDGVRIAYATVGAGPPLIKAANWLSHLEYDWQSPIWRHLIAFLAERHTLVRYDERGNGLSDTDATDISFDAFVTDLEAVVDASGIEKFALFGLSQGCAVAVAYAVRHPERVTHLVLHGGYARGWRKRGNRELVISREAMLTLVRMGWGKPNPAFRQVYTSLFFPDGTPEQIEWFNELQRVCTTPENAVRLMRAMGDIDVSRVLSQVRVPTLVTHCTGDAVIPFEEGRNLASGIPGARFLQLDSANHLMLEHEPAWARFTAEVRAFLTPGC